MPEEFFVKPRAPKSFFIFLIESGVRVADYATLMGSAPCLPREKYYQKHWPNQWTAYKAWCRLLDVYPH